ncbi:hypothetical protein H8L32_23170 [Undibacterium sp. CY18W]|uniref:DUF2157 domain-containing protein n=1 Tax=Undibacterium hunanense TaxID=2762292 RepID=A0ABR6ZXK1_9BURK|nr:hypothetical protein [Undibacterium hunanense]MBC3920384.1 hypothetical protein [Undibacterium hunanense]
MTSKQVKQQLQQDLALWHADGLIEKSAYELLSQRYEVSKFGLIGVVKYCGIFGGFCAFLGLMGMISALSQSVAFAALVGAAISIALTWGGLRLADDVQQRYATSSKFIVTLGIALWASAVGGFLSEVLHLDRNVVLIFTGLLTIPLAFYLAYQRHNTYLLVLALLALFHWVGSWSAMFGRSSYALSIQDPKMMSVVALIAVAIGYGHERMAYPATGRFYQAWQSVGLVYLNMSLLILSVWHHYQEETVFWVFALSIATVVQIVAGARLHSGLLRGFGITFFGINLFTRFHEQFWNQLDLGSYLAAGGLLLLVTGALMEVISRSLNQAGSSVQNTNGGAA